MNEIEKLFFALLAAAETILPAVIHSKQGIILLNASEAAVSAAVTIAATPAPAVTPTVTAVPTTPAAA